MADCHIWEEDPVNLKVVAKGATYEQSKTYTFTFKNADGGEEVGKADATASAASGGGVEAAGKLDKTKKPADVTKSNDKLWYAATFELDAGGTKLQNFPDKLFVYAKTIKVTAKNKADGKAYKGAVCVLEQDAPAVGASGGALDGGPGGVEEGPQRWATDDKGEVVVRLKYPSPNAKVVFQRPYFAEWTKETGAERTANITYAPSVRFLFPRPGSDPDDKHKQFVNLEPVANRAIPAGDDLTTPEWKSYIADMSKGRKIRIKVGPVEASEWQSGQKIYMKATFDKDNVARTNPKLAHAEKKPSEVLEKEVATGPDGLAEFEIDLGLAGGDVVTVEVGTVKGTADSTLKIRTWRRLYYELMAPESIAATLPAAKADDGSAAYDVPAGARTEFEKHLKKAYVEYVLLRSNRFPDGALNDYEKIASDYVGQLAGGTVIMYGGTSGGSDAFSNANEKQTINVNICHKTWSSTTIDVPRYDTKATDPAKLVDEAGQKMMVIATSAVAAKGSLFPKHPAAGQAGIGSATWTADTTTATHPGWDASAGAAKSGPLAIKYINASHFGLIFPPEAVALLGPASDTKCALNVTVKAFTFASSTNGSANNGKQVLTLNDTAPAAMGKTMCHELGHSMGMTIMPGKNLPPDGFAAPKHIDNGGTYYVNGKYEPAKKNGIRNLHKGAHCAFGVADVSKATFKKGHCIMFGSGGENDKRKAYCDECLKHIKARNLTRIRGWNASKPETW